jgi:beta-lactamase class A
MSKHLLPSTILLISLVSGGTNQRSEAGDQRSAVRSQRSDVSAAVQKHIEEIASLAKGRVGVSAMILETGETIVSLDAAGHFPMQSVYKLPISMAVMKQVEAGKLRLGSLAH